MPYMCPSGPRATNIEPFKWYSLPQYLKPMNNPVYASPICGGGAIHNMVPEFLVGSDVPGVIKVKCKALDWHFFILKTTFKLETCYLDKNRI